MLFITVSDIWEVYKSACLDITVHPSAGLCFSVSQECFFNSAEERYPASFHRPLRSWSLTPSSFTSCIAQACSTESHFNHMLINTLHDLTCSHTASHGSSDNTPSQQCKGGFFSSRWQNVVLRMRNPSGFCLINLQWIPLEYGLHTEFSSPIHHRCESLF